jgi:hypothetical protein
VQAARSANSPKWVFSSIKDRLFFYSIGLGASIHFVWLTKGENGNKNKSLTPVDVASIRQQEAINAAKVSNTS